MDSILFCTRLLYGGGGCFFPSSSSSLFLFFFILLLNTFQSFALYHLFQITKNFSIYESWRVVFVFKTLFYAGYLACLFAKLILYSMFALHFMPYDFPFRSINEDCVPRSLFSICERVRWRGIWLGKLAISLALPLVFALWVRVDDWRQAQIRVAEVMISFHFILFHFFISLFEKYEKNIVEKQIMNGMKKKEAQFNFTLIACALIFALKLYLNVTMTIKIINWALNSMQFAMNL